MPAGDRRTSARDFDGVDLRCLCDVVLRRTGSGLPGSVRSAAASDVVAAEQGAGQRLCRLVGCRPNAGHQQEPTRGWLDGDSIDSCWLRAPRSGFPMPRGTPVPGVGPDASPVVQSRVGNRWVLRRGSRSVRFGLRVRLHVDGGLKERSRTGRRERLRRCVRTVRHRRSRT